MISFLKGFEVLNKEGNYIIAKSQFHQLENLKKDVPNLYWVQLSENIFKEIVNQESIGFRDTSFFSLLWLVKLKNQK